MDTTDETTTSTAPPPPADLAERRGRRAAATPSGRPTARPRPRRPTSTPEAETTSGFNGAGGLLSNGLGLDDAADPDDVLDTLATTPTRAPAPPAPGKTSDCDTPGVDDDPIGERLRHHHERTQAQSDTRAVPRGSAYLAPAVHPRTRRDARQRSPQTPSWVRALHGRHSRAGLDKGTPAPAPTASHRRDSHRATLISLATRRRLGTLLVALAVLTGVALVILRPHAQTRSESASRAAGGQLGHFGALRTTLAAIDHGAATLARAAIAKERRAMTAERARKARPRAAGRRAEARRHHVEQTKARTTTQATHATAPVTASTHTTSAPSAPTTPTTAKTAQSPTQAAPAQPTQTTQRSSSSTSTSRSTQTPTYGKGGVLGAGHSSDSS